MWIGYYISNKLLFLHFINSAALKHWSSKYWIHIIQMREQHLTHRTPVHFAVPIAQGPQLRPFTVLYSDISFLRFPAHCIVVVIVIDSYFVCSSSSDNSKVFSPTSTWSLQNKSTKNESVLSFFDLRESFYLILRLCFAAATTIWKTICPILATQQRLQSEIF